MTKEEFLDTVAKFGLAHNEYDDLYASLFRNPDSYIKVIHALGIKKVGMSREELIETINIADNGKLSTILEDLEYKKFGDSIRVSNDDNGYVITKVDELFY